MNWYENAVMYHIYPLGFCGAPKCNEGGEPVNRLEKVLDWIPHLKELGVDAVYFGPVFESVEHGYDTTDYRVIDRRLGTNEMFAHICDELHKNGIRVILDGVFNHVGRNFWAFKDVQEKGQASEYCDWFAGLNFGGQSPCGDNFWYEGWNGYYNLVKLNLRNWHVCDYLIDAVGMWMDQFHIDGIRFDAADCVDFDFFRRIHNFCKERNPEFWLMGEIIHGDYKRWANPEMLQFDEDYDPKAVAGCPPDAFSATGQLWGNPLYDWKALKKDGYGWWVQRMTHCLELYDVVRIDHFRGFDSYYAIPYGDKTAERGKWEKGPGMDLFHTLDKKIKDLRVIAEDLGFLTESVLEMLKESGYPGMKVLQFAFDGSEDSSYLPYKYDHNCVVYTGTHDNETTKGWLENLQGHDLKFVREYINCYEQPVNDCVWALIRTALSSVADLAVIPIQDYLCLGNEARMNAPSTLGDNWKWRLTANQISETTLYHMREVTRIYGRLAKASEEKETDEIANAEEEERQDNDQNSKIVE